MGQRATIGYIALAPLIGLPFVLLIKWNPIGKDVEVAPQGNEAGGAEGSPFAQHEVPHGPEMVLSEVAAHHLRRLELLL